MNHDVITVGGGLAGSTVAPALAKIGRPVLVLERESDEWGENDRVGCC